jgi:hypothetical protein
MRHGYCCSYGNQVLNRLFAYIDGVRWREEGASPKSASPRTVIPKGTSPKGASPKVDASLHHGKGMGDPGKEIHAYFRENWANVVLCDVNSFLVEKRSGKKRRKIRGMSYIMASILSMLPLIDFRVEFVIPGIRSR